MGVNLALSTIVYLMVFVFPGMLFRKFFFIRAYSKQFDKGNLFERTVWVLFLSIAMLVVTYLCIKTINNLGDLNFIPNIDYESIRKIFISLSKNELADPESKDFSKVYATYIEFFELMLFVCFSSSFFGVFSYFIAQTQIFKRIAIFKYLNYWEDIVKGSSHTIADQSLTYGYTMADILIDNGGATQLYSGTVKNYYLSADGNNFQTIILSNVKRYKKEDGTVVEKELPGHSFVIEQDRIINMNFVYISEKKSKNKSIKLLINTLSFILSIVYLCLFFISFTTVFDNYLTNNLKKGVFLFFIGLTIFFVKDLIKTAIIKEEKIVFSDIMFLGIILVPQLWIFFNLGGWWVVPIQIFLLVITAIWLPPDEEQKPEG